MILTLEIVGHQSGLPGFSGSKQFGPNGGTIGRLPDNDWVLPDPYISGRHALIRYVGGKFYIEDISTNGVFLNAPDNRLQRSRPQLLEEGDRLYIDEYEIGVRLIEEAPAELPPPPQVQVQQRPFSPAASTAVQPVSQPVPRPQPPPVARPQPPQRQVQPQALNQPPQPQVEVGSPPVTIQMPVAAPPPSVAPIVVPRPSAAPVPPPTRPAARRMATPDNDPLRLLGLDDRRPAGTPAPPAPVARVPDLLEMGRPTAMSPSLDSRNADLMNGPMGFPSSNDLNAFPDPQGDLSLTTLRDAFSVAAAPPVAPSAGTNGGTAYRPAGTGAQGVNPGANPGMKLGSTNGAAELGRKVPNGTAQNSPATGPTNGPVPNRPAASVMIPDDYDPLEDDAGADLTTAPTNGMAMPPPVPQTPTNGVYNSGRMTMAQPPATPPRRPVAAAQSVPPKLDPKPEVAPRPRPNNPRMSAPMPSAPMMAAPPQPAVPQMALESPNTTVALQPAPASVPAKQAPPGVPQSIGTQPVAPTTAVPPPSIAVPTPTPGPSARAPVSAGVSRPMNGAAPRAEEGNRPMTPPTSVPRPVRPAVVPYPGRKPPVPVANGVAAPQTQPTAPVPVPPAVNAPPAPRTQALVAPQSPSPVDTAALAAVLEAAGLQANEITPEFSSNVGRILRVAVSGMIEVLRAQQSIKDEFRMRMTAFKNVDNNPLKLSGTPDEALQSLFSRQNGSQPRPVEAFEEAFREVRNHELAMLDGMRVAYEFMLAEFDPDRVQEDFNSSSGRGSILGKSAKSRYWDFYREKYGEIISDGEASFRNRFGDEFAKAYEEQLERLNSLDRNRGK